MQSREVILKTAAKFSRERRISLALAILMSQGLLVAQSGVLFIQRFAPRTVPRPGSIELALRDSSAGSFSPLELRLVGANKGPGEPEGFVFSSRQKRTLVRSVYPGVDLLAVRVDDGGQALEFAFTPGFSPQMIGFAFDASTGLRLGSSGQLLVRTRVGVRTLPAPVALQSSLSERRSISVAYELLDQGRVGLSFGDFDSAFPLLVRIPLGHGPFIDSG